MKVNFLYLTAVLAWIGFMTSCGSDKVDVSQLNGKWMVAEVKGKKVEMQKTPFFEFNLKENRVYGNAGCNNFNSSLILDTDDPASIGLTMAATTMMACMDMEKEGQLLKAFEDVAAVRKGKKDGEMLLVDKAGAAVFLLVKE